MSTLYITSTDVFSGKTALCVGLGEKFLRSGYAIGYMKPVSAVAGAICERAIDEDVEFIKEIFRLSEAKAPVILTPKLVDSLLRGEEEADFRALLKEAYAQVAQDKDVIILEGGGRLEEGSIVGLAAPYISELLGAKDLVVIKYANDLQAVDDALRAKEAFGDSLLGIVFNVVPRQRMEFLEEVVKPYLEERGIKVLAVLPQERFLLSISVGQLTECLDGEVLCCPEARDELVEHLMVGAMTVDAALSYFRRKPNKAVITGGDRPDIQLAALETSTKCLILTGNLRPSPIVLGRAEEVGVPVILVKPDTLTTVEIIEQFFGKTRFHQEEKIHCFEKLLEERFNFEALYEGLGLRPASD